MVIADQASPGTREVNEDEDDLTPPSRPADDPDAVEPPAPAPVERTRSRPVEPPAPVEAPRDPGLPKTRDFVIQIDKAGGSMGIDISAHDGKTLLIGRIKDGAIDEWNQRVGPSAYERVRRGDRIVECNGTSEDSDGILTVLKSNVALDLRIRRVAEFRTSFVSKGKVLGIDTLGLSVDENQTDKLIVKEVLDGPLRDLNKKNKADMEIGRGDEFAEVNGVSCSDAKTLLDLMQISGPVQVLIRRPSF